MLSLVVPSHNEELNVPILYSEICKVLEEINVTYEIIFVDDGSTDNTIETVKKIQKKDSGVRLISFSKNFGKEMATTAGLHFATGEIIMMIDADGQHPPQLIPKFIDEWRKGNKIVIGLRDSNKGEGFIKRYGSRIFYRIFNRLSGFKLEPGSTDFRLIDKSVQKEFNKLTEHNRITRGLIDWLGFSKSYIHFNARERQSGQASYSTKKLLKLAFNSFYSLSFAPLYFFGYVGALITALSLLVGIFVLVEQYMLSDPLNLNMTGSASLGILIVFLIGIVLASEGIMSVYISKIYSEVNGKPLYVVDPSNSNIDA